MYWLRFCWSSSSRMAPAERRHVRHGEGRPACECGAGVDRHRRPTGARAPVVPDQVEALESARVGEGEDVAADVRVAVVLDSDRAARPGCTRAGPERRAGSRSACEPFEQRRSTCGRSRGSRAAGSPVRRHCAGHSAAEGHPVRLDVTDNDGHGGSPAFESADSTRWRRVRIVNCESVNRELNVVPQAGFEPAAYRLGGGRSIP